MMSTNTRRLLSSCLVLMVVLPMSIFAQASAQVFSLPEARADQPYRVELEGVLREQYGLRIESGARNAIIQWKVADGDLPAGLLVQTDGTISGQPEVARSGPYRFRLKVIDVLARDEALFLDFTLVVKASRLRLSKIAGPRLVSVDLRTSGANLDSTNGAAYAAAATNASPEEEPNTSRMSNSPGPKNTDGPKDPPETDTAVADQKVINNPFSSLNKRFILGFEQSGAASSESTGKPFLDIFINTPLARSGACDPQVDKKAENLVRKREADKTKPADKATTMADTPPCLPPKFSIWGDVRLTGTPEQVNTIGAVASNAVGTITDAKLNQIVSAFDFVVGPEVRLQRFNHTDMSLIAGFGAVSPVTPKQSAQIFQVPDVASSQAAAFFKMYPGAQKSQYIAFVSPDRDRFLRQYFGGFRFKTFNYETKTDKDGKPTERLLDTFPATFDVTFGQSEAVTGGRFHKFVVGLDGFYPLPFPDKSRFLYLFGSARFKAGGPKNIVTPFILDTAASSVKITDPKVFVADPTPTNRDTYRIGFGVDLVELFKFAKTQGANDEKQKSKSQSTNTTRSSN